MTPSEAAKSNVYSQNQANDIQAIYDGRRPTHGDHTAAPPIQIFHPIFDEFIHFVNDPDTQPTFQDLKDVEELMYFMSQVGRKEGGPDGYNDGVRRCLRRILNAEVHQGPNSDGTSADGVITLQIGDAHITSLIIELKRELSEGGCDPSTQAGLSMKRSWVDPSVSNHQILPYHV